MNRYEKNNMFDGYDEKYCQELFEDIKERLKMISMFSWNEGLKKGLKNGTEEGKKVGYQQGIKSTLEFIKSHTSNLEETDEK